MPLSIYPLGLSLSDTRETVEHPTRASPSSDKQIEAVRAKTFGDVVKHRLAVHLATEIATDFTKRVQPERKRMYRLCHRRNEYWIDPRSHMLTHTQNVE